MGPWNAPPSKIGYRMTHYTAADLAMARHVAEGKARVERQEELLASLRLKGLPTGEAEALLRLFNESQVEHRTHRAAIANGLQTGNRGPTNS